MDNLPEISTVKIIVATCVFAVSCVVGLLVYIWTDVKKKAEEAVSKRDCRGLRELEEKELKRVEAKVCNHEHDSDGNVFVPLTRRYPDEDR